MPVSASVSPNGLARVRCRAARAASIAWLPLLASLAFGQAAERAAFVANNGNGEGSVSAFTFNPDGSPNLVDRLITPGTNPQTISLAPSGRYLATGHGTGNDVYEDLTIMEVADDATLSLVAVFQVDDSPLDVQWLTDEFIAVTHTSLNETNEVVVYHFDPGGPALSEVDREPTGLFTHQLALHPTRKFLYTQDSFANTITVFGVDPDGTLKNVQTLGTGSTYPLELVVTHDGSKLYAAGGISNGRHRVSGFAVADDGTLSPLDGSPFYSPGDSPANLIVTEDDQYLFVGHGADATARSFEIDQESGALSYTGHWFDVGLQGTLGDLAVLNELLLITDESTAIDGIRGLYSFTINPDGSFTQNGPIVETGGSTPESIAVWVPCPGDLNGDRVVDQSDLGILLASFNVDDGGDLDGDGDTDQSDLGILLANYGAVCP